MTLPVTLSDLGTYLNDTIDSTRGQFILDLAHTLCQSVVNPLPAGAEVVVLDVASRAYANPTASRDSSLALYAEGEGPFADGSNGAVGGGLWLTQNNRQTLRQLNGGGGAFTIDTIPAGYAASIPPWDSASGDWSSWDSPP